MRTIQRRLKGKHGHHQQTRSSASLSRNTNKQTKRIDPSVVCGGLPYPHDLAGSISWVYRQPTVPLTVWYERLCPHSRVWLGVYSFFFFLCFIAPSIDWLVIQAALDDATESWGIKVERVEMLVLFWVFYHSIPFSTVQSNTYSFWFVKFVEKTFVYRCNCNVPWPLKLRLRVKLEPKSSPPKENTKHRLLSRKPLWLSPNRRPPFNCDTFRYVTSFSSMSIWEKCLAFCVLFVFVISSQSNVKRRQVSCWHKKIDHTA